MTENNQNVVLGPGEGKMIPLPGHKVTHKVSGSETNGAYSMLEVELDGDGPPLHIHKAEDEAFYVLEGEINLLTGERNILEQQRVPSSSFQEERFILFLKLESSPPSSS